MSRRWHLLAVLLTLLAVSCVALGWARQQEHLRPTKISAPQDPAPARRDTRPTELTIADIGVSTSLVPLGLNADETVEVPADPDKAGWYRLGPVPGSPGSAVILGHRDSASGPAVFYRIGTLTPGALIEVKRSDDSIARFAVSSIQTYANDNFPAAQVYRNHGAPTLTLVTCGGAYDRNKGGYQANVVVSARYIGRADEK